MSGAAGDIESNFNFRLQTQVMMRIFCFIIFGVILAPL